MKQEWFEMDDAKRRWLDDVVWVPLRSSQYLTEVGRINRIGYQSEFYGVTSIAVPHSERDEAMVLSWNDMNLNSTNLGFVENGVYRPADMLYAYRGIHAISLVLVQSGNSEVPPEWHLHQDLAISLRLKREGDRWLAMNEDYTEVARLHRDNRGVCLLLEVRAGFLKDYLCARQMALYVSSYRSREEVVSDASQISWGGLQVRKENGTDRWEGRVEERVEGGFLAGSQAAVLHMGRETVNYDEDIPRISPDDADIVVRSWVIDRKGSSFFRIQGELWRTEWVEPAKHSPRVREDEVPPTTLFIVDVEGTRKAGDKLASSGGWLWFKPGVIMALAHRRGGALRMFTRDTGRVTCSPTTSTVFGVNTLGLINVYAEDLARLPEWHQQIWAGYNISPEGGVSHELLSSQVQGEPASTQPPEAFLGEGLKHLTEVFHTTHHASLFREHDNIPGLIKTAHRFRAIDEASLFALAKDLARLTAESIDAGVLHKIVSPPKGEKWASLKSLENVLASSIGPDEARSVMGPLVGINELRHADAHLGSSNLQSSFDLARIDRSSPLVMQGLQMLNSCVSTLFTIAEKIEGTTQSR